MRRNCYGVKEFEELGMSDYGLTPYTPLARRSFRTSDGTRFSGQMAGVLIELTAARRLWAIGQHARTLAALEKRGAVSVVWQGRLPVEAQATRAGKQQAAELAAQTIPPFCLWSEEELGF